MTFSYDYPRPSVTVDAVVFGLDMSEVPTLNVLLIKRSGEGGAFAGYWALIDGFVGENEDLEAAAFRELREETHAEPTYIEQLGIFGRPGRETRADTSSALHTWL